MTEGERYQVVLGELGFHILDTQDVDDAGRPRIINTVAARHRAESIALANNERELYLLLIRSER